MRRDGELEEERQEVLAPEFLSSMKQDLEALRDLFTPDGPEA